MYVDLLHTSKKEVMGIKLVTHPFNKDCNATQRILNVIATNTTRSPRTEASEYVCHQPPSIMRYYNVFHSSSLARSRPVPTGRTAYIKVMKRSLRVAALVALCGESVQAFHVCRFFFPPSDSLSVPPNGECKCSLRPLTKCRPAFINFIALM